MSLIDAEFVDESFDPKAWVNAACAQHAETLGPSSEPLEKFLAEQEMKLQLAAEEIEVSLQDCSAQAMRRIPFAVQEIYRLQGDIQGMQDQVKALTQQIQRDASDAAESVETIGELDRVKRNMEAACSTLKEATELSGLFIKVEDVFALGDLPKVAEILSSMRKSLSLVGDVPEFRAGRQRLQALEDRLQSQVEGSLGDALTRNDEDNFAKLAALLLAVDRYATIEAMYCNSRLAMVFTAWDELSSKDEAPHVWLPKFYSRLQLLLETEHRWTGRVLPAHQPQLMAGFVTTVFQKIQRGTRDRLSSITSIASLASLQRDVVAFARSMAELLRDSPAAQRSALLGLIFEPLEGKVEAYGQLEQQQLAAELASALPAGGLASLEDAESVVRQLSSCITAAFTALSASVERCVGFTGGTALPAAIKVIDAELSAFLPRIQAAVTALHQRQAAAAAALLAAGTALTAANDDDAGDISNILKLILVARELTQHLVHLEAAVRTAVAAAVPRLDAALAAAAAAAAASASAASAAPQGGARGGSSGAAATAGGGGAPSTPLASAAQSATHAGGGISASAVAASADPVALRLAAAPEKHNKLRKLSISLQESRYLALPASSGANETFSRGVHSAVFDVLMQQIHLHLHNLPELPDWKRDAGSSSLPSFSPYPLAYVQAMGDYLMTLPGQLEVLMADEEGAAVGGADVEELAAEWLDKVVSGAASAYLEHIYRIPELSAAGGLQLVADVEYFNNLIGALHVDPPPALLTVQVFAGLPQAQFVETAAEGGADPAALRALTQMKKIG